MRLEQAAATLACLANEWRLRIFRELVRRHDPAGERSGMAAGALAELLEIPAPTLSFHLKELSHAGLLVSRRESRSIIYDTDMSVMTDLLAFLMEDCCQVHRSEIKRTLGEET